MHQFAAGTMGFTLGFGKCPAWPARHLEYASFYAHFVNYR